MTVAELIEELTRLVDEQPHAATADVRLALEADRTPGHGEYADLEAVSWPGNSTVYLSDLARRLAL